MKIATCPAPDGVPIKCWFYDCAPADYDWRYGAATCSSEPVITGVMPTLEAAISVINEWGSLLNASGVSTDDYVGCVFWVPCDA